MGLDRRMTAPGSASSRAEVRADPRRQSVWRAFHGWRIVAACFVVAAVAWGLGLFGSSVYLQAVTAAHGWPIAEVSSAVTLFFLVGAALQRTVGRTIARRGPRPVLLAGTACMTAGVALIGQVTESWQLYPCFVLIGLGWAALSTTAIATTVAPWFERHQGRSMTLAIMGASIGAMAGVPLLLLAVAELGLGGGLAAAGAIGAVVLVPLVAVVLRHRGPADLGQQPDGGNAEDGASTAAPAPPPVATQANRRRLLWSAAAAFALALTVQIGFITHHVAVAEPLLGATGAELLVSATGGRCPRRPPCPGADRGRREGAAPGVPGDGRADGRAARHRAVAHRRGAGRGEPRLRLRHRPRDDAGPSRRAARVRRGGIRRGLRRGGHGDPAHLGLRPGAFRRAPGRVRRLRTWLLGRGGSDDGGLYGAVLGWPDGSMR